MEQEFKPNPFDDAEEDMKTERSGRRIVKDDEDHFSTGETTEDAYDDLGLNGEEQEKPKVNA